MPANEQPAFVVRDENTGQQWKIYASGKIEGWDTEIAEISVFNRIPVLLDEARRKEKHP
jgi:hypothetical protein